MPPPNDPTTPIARHEAALLAEGRSQLMKIGHQHRTEEFNRHILPLSLPLIESVGHRLAYEAAKDSNVDPKIIALYESGAIKEDSAWYAEQGGISRQVQREMETDAADALLPLLRKLIQEPQVQAYSTAPMVSHGAWNEFLSDLPTFSGTASFDVWSAKEVARL
jgi:acyl-CoA oxidase